MSVSAFDPKKDVQITLTEAALEHVRTYFSKHNNAMGMRLSTKKTGCSGLSYVTEFCESVNASDAHTIESGVDIYIASDSIVFLNGMTIDYVKQSLGQAKLVYYNPNESARCGCGESFTIEDHES